MRPRDADNVPAGGDWQAGLYDEPDEIDEETAAEIERERSENR